MPPPPAPPVPPQPPDFSALPSVPKAPTVQPAFSVLIDPAHGGADSGARIDDQTLEKDLTLRLANRLRSALTARGIVVVMTREGDGSLPGDDRAGIANHSRASACLVLHATASGSGVYLVTSSLHPEAAMPAGLLPWQTAQAAWITRSLRLSSEINSTLGEARVPVTLGRTFLRPLDNLTCPAVAVEIAPLAASAAGKALRINDRGYQQRILDALSSAVLEWSTEWKLQP